MPITGGAYDPALSDQQCYTDGLASQSRQQVLNRLRNRHLKGD
jgi:hypothetical protein